MIKSLLTANELLEFINTNSVVIVKFFASWSTGCARLRPHYEMLSAKYSALNLTFSSVDIDYVGVDNLNTLKIKLNLGAIPAVSLIYKLI